MKHELDCSGLLCPEPIMMLHEKVAEAVTGDTILMKATDPSAVKDVERFCRFLSHTLCSSEENAGSYVFEIRVG